jgi:hypothetical protein
MPANDEDGPIPDDLETLLGRDPALAAELELILPALDPATRRDFRSALATAGRGTRPAAAVLEALVAAARSRPGQGRDRRA